MVHSSPRISSALRQRLLPAAIFPMAYFVLFCPRSSCLQGIAMLLSLQPCFKSLFINRQTENPGLAEQSSKRLHYLRCGREDNLVHRFRFSLGSVRVEINPLSVWTEDEHFFLWQHIGRRHACLRNEIRTALAAGTKIQNVSIPIIISNRSHSIN